MQSSGWQVGLLSVLGLMLPLGAWAEVTAYFSPLGDAHASRCIIPPTVKRFSGMFK